MKEPKIALALGAGGAKGIAHIGVLKVFEKNQIPIHIITGTSMGAIIGGCYSAGVPLDYLERMAVKLRQSQLVDFGFVNKHGFVKGNRALKLIEKVLDDTKAAKSFRGCSPSFACVAADLLSGEQKYITTGKLSTAIRASFSIAGVFRPVRKEKMLLVDGGILVRVPVRLAREIGADIVIAVDVVGKTSKIKAESLKNYINTITRVFYIMDYGVSREEISESDFLIDINQPEVDTLKIKDAQKAIENGEKAAQSVVDDIKQLIEKWKQNKMKNKGKSNGKLS